MQFHVFALLLFALAAYRYGVLDTGWLLRIGDRLPDRLSGPVRRLAAAFAEGIAWPRQAWRGAAIILSSVVIKLFAASPFLWAGLAFGNPPPCAKGSWCDRYVLPEVISLRRLSSPARP